MIYHLDITYVMLCDVEDRWTNDAALPHVINCCRLKMTVPKTGCLILLDVCCLDSSGNKTQGKEVRKEIEDVQVGSIKTN